MTGAFSVEGGVPLILDGQVVGAIGASGGMPSDDGLVANAGGQQLIALTYPPDTLNLTGDD